MDVPLPPELEEVVLRKVETGEYPSISFLIEEALFLLVERDWARSQAELQAKVPSAFNIDSQPATEGEQP